MVVLTGAAQTRNCLNPGVVKQRPRETSVALNSQRNNFFKALVSLCGNYFLYVSFSQPDPKSPEVRNE